MCPYKGFWHDWTGVYFMDDFGFAIVCSRFPYGYVMNPAD